MTEDMTSEVAFVPIGPVYGWFCASCGATQMGYGSVEESKTGAGQHGLSAHAPNGWEGGWRELAFEWADEEEERE